MSRARSFDAVERESGVLWVSTPDYFIRLPRDMKPRLTLAMADTASEWFEVTDIYGGVVGFYPRDVMTTHDWSVAAITAHEDAHAAEPSWD